MSGPTVAVYEIADTVWRHDYAVSTNGRHVYYVENSKSGVGKFGLTFHQGQDKSAPVAGAIKFHHFSSDMEVGVGDPENAHAVRWERMTRESHMSLKHTFRVSIGGKQTSFTWKRTHSLGEGRLGNLKLVDDSTEAVIAVFSSRKSFLKKTGKLEVYVDYGPQFELVVLQTCLGLRERTRRTNTSAAATGGGGA
ncbi:hypothetical protein N7468_006285 [Penicillium chermesinum]|uniref:Uncharacterized protein n=1 Tax=Penicillium chermesinum TaxID=63820 RepID=A0A9W9NRZ8_9EURO|nr:uncharacterized protein N7468_006285 [Penicillium chermesinum]KAJ5225060.1 hypothetical protein N7468_006285 [Penicillium chermesinum]KAJ6151791.1 hypothetical protein N7470_006919 [Penicillium chermesinum]